MYWNIVNDKIRIIQNITDIIYLDGQEKLERFYWQLDKLGIKELRTVIRRIHICSNL